MYDYEECEPTEDEITALDAFRELQKQFPGFPDDAYKEVVEQIRDYVIRHIKVDLRDAIKDEVRRQVYDAVTSEVSDIVKSVVSEVMAEKVVARRGTCSWDDPKQSLVTIREVIRLEMEEAISKLNNNSKAETFVKDAVQSFLSEDLQRIAQEAVNEFKDDIMDDLKKEGVKQLVAAIASTIGRDKKLLEFIK